MLCFWVQMAFKTVILIIFIHAAPHNIIGLYYSTIPDISILTFIYRFITMNWQTKLPIFLLLRSAKLSCGVCIQLASFIMILFDYYPRVYWFNTFSFSITIGIYNHRIYYHIDFESCRT